jgi:hypothetical protein
MDQIQKWMVCGSKTGQKEKLRKKRKKFPPFVVIGLQAKYANQNFSTGFSRNFPPPER